MFPFFRKRLIIQMTKNIYTGIVFDPVEAAIFFCLFYLLFGFYISKKKKVNLATLFEGDTKCPFSIATIPRVGEGAIPFPVLLHLILDPHLT